MTSYTIEIPSQGENTFSSFLMYLNTMDVGVQVTNVSVVANAPECEEPSNDTVLDPASFTEAFGGTTVVDEVFTF